MLRRSLPAVLFALAVFATPALAQVRQAPLLVVDETTLALDLPALAPAGFAVPGMRSHALIRTAATLAASAAAFHYAQSTSDRPADELRVPIIAGAAGGAVAGMLLSDAPRLRVIAGSILSTVPAGALATFVAGSMNDDDQRQMPLIAFSVPHGLLTSGFSQNRSRR